jgi:hypothetical protein
MLVYKMAKVIYNLTDRYNRLNSRDTTYEWRRENLIEHIKRINEDAESHQVAIDNNCAWIDRNGEVMMSNKGFPGGDFIIVGNDSEEGINQIVDQVLVSASEVDYDLIDAVSLPQFGSVKCNSCKMYRDRVKLDTVRGWLQVNDAGNGYLTSAEYMLGTPPIYYTVSCEDCRGRASTKGGYKRRIKSTKRKRTMKRRVSKRKVTKRRNNKKTKRKKNKKTRRRRR